MNSFHHQCVATTGARLRPVAWTLDGVIEATERRDGGGFAIGLQWHNEMMWPHDERFLAPHREFTQAAWDYAAARDRTAVPVSRLTWPSRRRSRRGRRRTAPSALCLPS